ncbi:DUF928 domain-containing protein [Leptolyngbyaceae cyanobacterium CCMR0082]|uniref:DUF928 domain-containing protein n=1 Tax=Adonisia turfae CCMR0082 TaxID=2304604 RepID=A0A6M0S904_9CYAN|nr:DUF928 domain-containing protein [Adonisia turfae CCMR0082]
MMSVSGYPPSVETITFYQGRIIVWGNDGLRLKLPGSSRRTMKYFKNFQYMAMRPSQKSSLFSKRCYQLILGTLLLTLPLNPVHAQQYNPPSGSPPQTATGSNGSRGCRGIYDVPLVGLAPTLMNHVGQTTTITPTLAWFVPTADPYRIRVSLYTIDQENLLYETEYEDTIPGIMSFSIPEDVGLEPDGRYLWEVNIDCDLDNPTYQEYFIAEVDIVSPPAELAAAVALAPTASEKASLYAEAGYWYDAFKEALSASEDVSFVQTLLSSLAASEEDSLQKQYLSEVIEIIGNSDINP